MYAKFVLKELKDIRKLKQSSQFYFHACYEKIISEFAERDESGVLRTTCQGVTDF